MEFLKLKIALDPSFIYGVRYNWKERVDIVKVIDDYGGTSEKSLMWYDIFDLDRRRFVLDRGTGFHLYGTKQFDVILQQLNDDHYKYNCTVYDLLMEE